MIQPLAPTTCTRQRFGPAVYTSGRMVRPAPTESMVTIYGPQPAPAKVRQAMPDGFSSRPTIYTLSYDTDWQGAYDDAEADRLVYGGVTYVVTEVTVSPAFLGQPAHVMLLGVREQSLSMPVPA